MRLLELFGDQPQKSSSGQPIKTRLQQAAIDFLTPLVAHKVPFVTVQQVIDELRQLRPGILIDRAFVMDLLDPDQIKAVKSIEGDRINLQQPNSIERKVDDNEAEKEVDKIKDMAKNKAEKDVKEKK